MFKRTDLALEAREIWNESSGKTTKLDGVEANEKIINGFKITDVKVLDENGEKALSKPKGEYITIELDDFIKREDDSFRRGAETISRILCKLMALENTDKVLVTGLGNPAVTPDAIGPKVVQNTLVTWHLTDKIPEIFGQFRKVAAVETGVLGTTGIESVDMIGAIVEKIRPSYIIAVDALASRSISRICRTIQITDTGIIPGSGIGNGRSKLSTETLGVKVIALGVPTVVDAATLTADLMEQAGFVPEEEKLSSLSGGMIVTPKEIDMRVEEISRLAAYGINLALHKGITVDDITMLIS